MRRRSRRTAGANEGGTPASLPGWRGERIGVLGGVRELILAVLCGVMPWWFGSSDPPAIFVISILITALAVLTLIDGAVSGRRRGPGVIDCLLCLPVAALGAAAIFGAIQWYEIGPELLSTLSPTRFAQWKSWGGGEALTLRADGGLPIASAPARIAWLDAEVFESVAWLGALWVLGVCVVRLPGRWGPLRRHSLVMMLSGTLMAVQSMLQAMTFTGKVLWLRPKGVVTSSSGPFFVHSELAAYLNLCLGFALAHVVFLKIARDSQEFQPDFLRESRSRLGQGFLGIYAAGVIMIAVFASGSRGGMLSMIMAMVPLGLVALRARLRLGRAGLAGGFESSSGGGGWFAILGLLGVLALGLTVLVDIAAIFGRVESIAGAGGSHAAGVRLYVWKLAAETWRQSPVWGTGWGSFFWATQPQIVSSAVGFVTHAESDYMQAFAEGGLIGSAIAAAGTGALVWAAVRTASRAERPPQYMMVAGALFGLTAVAWGALTENILRTAGVMIPALVTAAHVARLSLLTRPAELVEAKDDGDRPGPRGTQAMTRLGGVCLGTALVAAALPNLDRTRLMNRAWDALSSARVQHSGIQFMAWLDPNLPDDRLEQERSGLERMEKVLPAWGDYHVRRAIAEVETFQRRTRAVLISEEIPPDEAFRLSRIMNVAVMLRELPAAERAQAIESLSTDPIVMAHLVPAARSLAEGWRLQPSTAMVHVELAILSWLFDSGPSAEESLRRGIELAGGQAGLLMRAGQAASALGDESGALAAFGKCLSLGLVTPKLADEQIKPWLTDESIDRLAERSAIEAVGAGELLIPVTDTTRRRTAGQRALEHLGKAGDTGDAEAVYLKARAHWLAGERDQAIEGIRTYHALAPQAKEPRIRLVDWLIAAGRTGDALEEARVLLYFWPKDADVESCVDRAAEADAIGPAKPDRAVEDKAS